MPVAAPFLQALTIQNVTRHGRMAHGEQNRPWLRTTGIQSPALTLTSCEDEGTLLPCVTSVFSSARRV